MADRMQNDLNSMNQCLTELSNQGPLTRLANRRSFDAYSDLEWKRAQRQQQPLSIIMIDLDDFKAYNDPYGHAAGDDCLQQVARAVASVPKRLLEMVARYGGEEFVALLPNTDIADGAAVAHLMRQTVSALAIPHTASTTVPYVSISLGIASSSEAPSNPVDLLRLADERLYHAKQLGRNRVCQGNATDE